MILDYSQLCTVVFFVLNATSDKDISLKDVYAYQIIYSIEIHMIT